jgi:hypothetical protein
MKFILTRLLNNADVIALIIFASEVISLLFNSNRNSGYVDKTIDYQTDITYTHESVPLSLGIEKKTRSSKANR